MLKTLLAQKAEIERQMEALRQEIAPRMALLTEQMSAVGEQITAATADKLAELRRLQAKEFGVVHLVMDGIKIDQTISKKVEWDQEKLGSLFDRIAASGDNPRNYMKVELKVWEKEFDKFADPIKAIFAEARTVKPGAVSVKFEEVANA